MGVAYSTYPGVMQPQMPNYRNAKGNPRKPTMQERLFNSRIDMWGYPKVYPVGHVAPPPFTLFGYPVGGHHHHTSYHHGHTQQQAPIIVQGAQGPQGPPGPPATNNKKSNNMPAAPVNVIVAPEFAPNAGGNGGQGGGKRRKSRRSVAQSSKKKSRRSIRRRK